MKKEQLVKHLDGLSVTEWVDIVGAAANNRFQRMRQSNSNASTFYEIWRQCTRLRKILKRATA